MYVVKVIPITRVGFTEHLSFFSKEPLPEGAVLDVPVRGKPTPALITSVKEAREEKLELRGSSFSLKKIAPRKVTRIYPPSTVLALRETALWHARGVGEVLSHFSPNEIVRNPIPFETYDREERTDTASDALVLQAEYEERVRLYRSLAREAFARKESILIIAPTIAEAETLYDKLHRGIENQVIKLTSASTKKTVRDAWKRAVTDPEPLLIVATYSFLTIPQRNLDTIIIERESARSYVSRERGGLDARIAAEHIARKNASRIVFADFPLRIETRFRLEQGELEELVRLQVSSQGTARTRIIDARTKDTDEAPKKKKAFSVFTDAVRTAVSEELSRGSRVFLYASRRGLAPLTVCNECGTPVTDPSTGAPMTLQKTEEGNVFLSYRSGAVLPSNTSCASCGSWNLVSLGIGVERVVEEAEKLFKEATLFSLTAESATTHTKAKKITEYFFNTPGSILVGTERALPYLSEPVELSAVMSIDSLLSASAWRAHEYALNMLLYLRDRTENAFLVQTRLPDTAVMKAVIQGNPTDFIRDELAERKTYQYPPFATFIGLSWSGTEKTVWKYAALIKDTLKGWDLVGPLPAHQIARNRYQARAVVRLERGAWPNALLAQALKTLPNEVTIAIDPDEIV